MLLMVPETVRPAAAIIAPSVLVAVLGMNGTLLVIITVRPGAGGRAVGGGEKVSGNLKRIPTPGETQEKPKLSSKKSRHSREEEYPGGNGGWEPPPPYPGAKGGWGGAPPPYAGGRGGIWQTQIPASKLQEMVNTPLCDPETVYRSTFGGVAQPARSLVRSSTWAAK